MPMYVPDNYDKFVEHEARKQKLLDELPQCEECGKPLQDDFCYDIYDTIKCEKCLIRDHRKRVEDLIF